MIVGKWCRCVAVIDQDHGTRLPRPAGRLGRAGGGWLGDLPREGGGAGLGREMSDGGDRLSSMRPAIKAGLLMVWRDPDTLQIGIDPRRAIALRGMRGARP